MESRKIAFWILPLACVLLVMAGLSDKASGKSSGYDVAIKGYDSVAFFKAGKAVRGNSAFSYNWHGKTWYFADKKNRALFADNPEKYAPQYDGYCAWAMTESRKAHTDPEVWKVVNGRLFLNCSRSAYEKWSRDIPGNIEKADKNWSKMQKQQ